MSVFLTNVSDFIAPTQACINPFITSRKTVDDTADGNGGNSSSNSSTASSTRKVVSLQADLSYTEYELAVKPNLIKTTVGSNKQKVASVTLNDCLACSGCVTSAEAVLVQEQSLDKLLMQLDRYNQSIDDTRIVISISPQSRASITSFINQTIAVAEDHLTISDVFLKLATFLKSLGVYYVIDASSGGDVALVESREEFLHRYTEQKVKQCHKPVFVKPMTSIAVSKSKIQYIDKMDEGVFNDNYNRLSAKDSSSSIANVVVVDTPMLQMSLPMLVSHCPGWVCYAEKMQPQAIPFMSTVKSAQQIVGTIFKDIIPSVTGSNHKYFIVSVQPCFDKKLEASRKDFYDDERDETAVDLVISTTELWNLLEIKSNATKAIVRSSIADYMNTFPCDNWGGLDDIEGMFRCYSNDGYSLVSSVTSNGGSGGYLEYILRHASKQLLHTMIQDTVPIEYKVGRNADVADATVINDIDNDVDSGGSSGSNNSKHLKFGKVYGFRNIQSLMMKIKKGSCDLDFVEIMACPGGCINGGGQLKSDTRETPADTKARVSSVDKLFHQINTVTTPDDSPLVKYLYDATRLSAPLSAASMKYLHTRYHAVPKLEEISALASKW